MVIFILYQCFVFCQYQYFLSRNEKIEYSILGEMWYNFGNLRLNLIWKNNISQPIYFIKHYIYFISFAYPNMLKNIFLLGNTSEIFENIIPNYMKLTPNDTKQIEKQMKQFYNNFSELNKYVSSFNVIYEIKLFIFFVLYLLIISESPKSVFNVDLKFTNTNSSTSMGSLSKLIFSTSIISLVCNLISPS